MGHGVDGTQQADGPANHLAGKHNDDGFIISFIQQPTPTEVSVRNGSKKKNEKKKDDVFGATTHLVKVDVLVEGEEPAEAVVAQPRDALAQRQQQHQRAVKVQTLTCVR